MSPLVQGDDDFAFPNIDSRRHVQQVAEDLLGRGLLVLSANPVGQQAIQGMAMRVICKSKSTFMPIMDDRASM